MIEELTARLGALAGAEVEVERAVPLAGGACQDNFRVELTVDGGPKTRMVLRSDAPSALPRSLSRRGEYGVIDAAVAVGVETPAVRWLAEGLVAPGRWAYLMDWADGVAIGRQVLRSPELAEVREGLATSLANEAAKIHGITPATHPDLFERAPPDDPIQAAIEETREIIDGLGEPHPALELVMRWLDEHRPAPATTTLVHGDFRTGNFLVSPDGLSAILDWEFSQWGAPEEDLAWISVRDWRFNKLDRPVGGFAKRAPFYAAYEAASGRAVDRTAVHWWEIMGNVRWATGCVFQGERYLSGQQTDLELIAIGRRVAEMEWEALRLIEVGHAE